MCMPPETRTFTALLLRGHPGYFQKGSLNAWTLPKKWGWLPRELISAFPAFTWVRGITYSWGIKLRPLCKPFTS